MYRTAARVIFVVLLGAWGTASAQDQPAGNEDQGTANDLSGESLQEQKEARPAGESPALYVMQPKLANIPPDLLDSITSKIAKAAEDQGLSVMTRADAETILANAETLSALGADADGLDLAALGRRVGSKHVLAATVTRVDQDVLVQMRLIDTKASKVLSRQELKASDYDNEIIKTIEVATGLTLQPIFGHLKGRVELSVSEEGSNVTVDTELIGVSPVDAFSITGGYHMLTVSKEGFIRHQEQLRIEDGDIVQRMVKLRPSKEYMDAYRKRNGTYRTVAKVSMFVGLPLLAVAGTTQFLRVKQNDTTQEINDRFADQDLNDPVINKQYDDERTSSIDKANLYGDVFAGVAATAVVAGLVSAYFWIFGEDPERYAEYEGLP